MISRQDAINAKEGMERYKNQEMQLRVSEHLRTYYLVGIISLTWP